MSGPAPYAACPDHDGQWYSQDTGDCSCGSRHRQWSPLVSGHPASATLRATLAGHPTFGTLNRVRSAARAAIADTCPETADALGRLPDVSTVELLDRLEAIENGTDAGWLA